MPTNRLLIFVLTVLLLGLAGCKNRVTLYQPGEIFIFEQRLSESEIIDSIYEGSDLQGWEITEEGQDYVILTNLPDATATYSKGGRTFRQLQRRNEENDVNYQTDYKPRNRSGRPRTVTVRIDYDRYSINFSYISSENLKYEYVTEGKQAVHRMYNRIVSNLEQAIREQILRRVDV